MSQKTISLKEFSKELKERLNAGKTIDCCKEELLRLADIVEDKLPDVPIQVTWKD